jgi:hypothetical protein
LVAPPPTPSIFLRPFQWALAYLNPFSSSNEEYSDAPLWSQVKDQSFVIKSLVEKAANEVLKDVRKIGQLGASERVMSWQEVKERWRKVGKGGLLGRISDRDADVIRRWIEQVEGSLFKNGEVGVWLTNTSSYER